MEEESWQMVTFVCVAGVRGPGGRFSPLLSDKTLCEEIDESKHFWPTRFHFRWMATNERMKNGIICVGWKRRSRRKSLKIRQDIRTTLSPSLRLRISIKTRVAGIEIKSQ